MHVTQKKILQLSKQVDLEQLTLRRIGELIGESHPQSVKYHLDQLEKKGLIRAKNDETLLSIPVMGNANAGPATFLAEDNIERVLRVSRRLCPTQIEKKVQTGDVFALEAVGDSMNRAAGIPGGTVDEGDYVLVDRSTRSPRSGNYIVSIIDGAANIKRFVHGGDKVLLLSESSAKYPPIIIHPDDDYYVAGKIVQVLKMPRFSKDEN